MNGEKNQLKFLILHQQRKGSKNDNIFPSRHRKKQHFTNSHLHFRGHWKQTAEKQGLIFYKFIRKICHVFRNVREEKVSLKEKRLVAQEEKKGDEENVINLSFLIVWCFPLSHSLTHSSWKAENFSYQLIILIVNKTNSRRQKFKFS